MNTALSLLLTIAAVVAAGAAVFLLGVVGQLRRLLAVREAEIRQLRLEAGHAADTAALADAPVSEAKEILDDAGVTNPERSIFDQARERLREAGLSDPYRKKSIALLVGASLLASSAPARAADILGPGTAIARTDGAIAVVPADDECLLLCGEEPGNLAVMVRDLERCRAALSECDATGRPVEPPGVGSSWTTRAAVLGAVAAGAFAGGVVVGVRLDLGGRR